MMARAIRQRKVNRSLPMILLLICDLVMTIVSCSATVMFLVSTTSLFTSISVMVVMMSFLCFHE